MFTLRPDRVDAIVRRMLPASDWEHLSRLNLTDEGHGYDAFGAHPSWVRLGSALFKPMYRGWFRVRSSGHENIPTSGGAILASNHSGTLPFDAIMIACDVLAHTHRVPRMVVDHFVPRLPFVSTFFARCGSVGGSRENLRVLLDAGELVGLFPEGVPGVGKLFRDRYTLQGWREGHVEFAIRHQVPIVPVAVVGAEEQLPQLGRINLGAFGVPHVPITAVPFPLPVRYHISYGTPIEIAGECPPESSRDPAVVGKHTARVKVAVEQLIKIGLSNRRGVFT